MISYVLFVFSFLVSITGGVEGATSVYKPTEVFLFNCGNTSDNVDLNGRNWMAENRKILPLNSDNASISSDTLYQDSRVHQVPYMKARIFRYDFTYSFSVFLGWKFLRLYFFPTQYKSGFDAVNSFFSVTVNGFTLLRNFSADLTMGNKKVLTGGSSKAYGSGSYRDPLLQQNQDKSKANGSENGPDDLEHGVVEVFVYRCNWIDMHGFAGVAI